MNPAGLRLLTELRLTTFALFVCGTLCALCTSCSLSGSPEVDGSRGHTSATSDRRPTAEILVTESRRRLAEVTPLRDRIVAAAAPDEKSVLEPYNDLQILLDEVGSRAWTLSSVHPDKEVRNAAEEIGLEVSRVWTDLSLDRELYDVLKKVPVWDLDADARRVLRLELRDYRRSGVDRDTATRERIKELRQEMTRLSQEFGRNITEDVREILLESPEDLDGVPDDYRRNHPPGEDGKIRITTAYPDAFPILGHATNPDVRRRLLHEFNNRGYPRNLEILHELLEKRHELAKILGHPNWAAYSAEDLMIGNGEKIGEFIERVNAAADARARRERDEVLEEKRREYPDAREVEAWEMNYYSNRLKERKYSFDEQALRPYFEFTAVKKGILDLYAELFELEFVSISDAEVWHPSVESYRVIDRANGDRPLGEFFLDLHPREGKYTHAAKFGIRTGIKDRQLPVSLLVCNFPDPANPPALMTHGQVETFFHEFGHLLDSTFAGHNKWLRLSGGVQEWDFVEAPSQMLEEWVNNREVLARFARHYQTGEPLPDSLLERMLKAKRFGNGLWARHQLFYAALAYQYHTRDPQGLDTTAVLQEIQPHYSMTPHMEGTHFQASFGHLTGYSSNYYTYMWSLVIAKDLLSAFRDENGELKLMNRDVARRYREKILEPGGTKPAGQLVRDFLGRDYGFEAFQLWLEEG